MPNRRTWADGPNGQTPINASRLNALETDLTEALDGAATALEGATAAQQSVTALAEQVAGITVITGDPTYPGLYLLPDTSNVNPDPVNPGFYLIGD